jgi:prepilin signal peptidase PulO-like enzyme (type II secretory pathway)
MLINRAADCWLSPARLQCGLTRHPVRQGAVWVALPILFMVLAWRTPDASHLGAICLFAAVLVLLAIIDREQRRVPNVVLLPSVALALLLAWQGDYLLSAAAGAALAMLIFAGLYAVRLPVLWAGGVGDRRRETGGLNRRDDRRGLDALCLVLGHISGRRGGGSDVADRTSAPR